MYWSFVWPGVTFAAVTLLTLLLREVALRALSRWLSHTDAAFVPTPNYHLDAADFRYLREERALNYVVLAMLEETTRSIHVRTEKTQLFKEKYQPAMTAKEFEEKYKPALDLVDLVPGTVSAEEILRIASDADLIQFAPRLLASTR